jgi:hypothetical protein
MWMALFNWPVVAIVVSLLIGIGVGVMSMSPPSFAIAKTCFTIAPIVFLARVGMWLITAEASRLERGILAFLVFGLAGVGWVESWDWIKSREVKLKIQQSPPLATTRPPAGSPPFYLEVELTLIRDEKSLSETGLWLSHMHEGRQVVSPVDVWMFLRIVNLQSAPSLIDQISIEMQIEDGPWQHLSRMWADSGRAFFAVSGLRRSRWIDFRQSGLDYLAKNHPMAPHEVLRGWLLLSVPGDYRAPVGTAVRYRIIVKDMAGAEFTYLRDREAIGARGIDLDEAQSKPIVVGKRADMSSWPKQPF